MVHSAAAQHSAALHRAHSYHGIFGELQAAELQNMPAELLVKVNAHSLTTSKG